jgi:hypothetical protein
MSRSLHLKFSLRRQSVFLHETWGVFTVVNLLGVAKCRSVKNYWRLGGNCSLQYYFSVTFWAVNVLYWSRSCCSWGAFSEEIQPVGLLLNQFSTASQEPWQCLNETTYWLQSITHFTIIFPPPCLECFLRRSRTRVQLWSAAARPWFESRLQFPCFDYSIQVNARGFLRQ